MLMMIFLRLYKKGGVIGISFVGSLISNKNVPLIDDLVKHFLYIYESFGSDIITIGTDYMAMLGIPALKGLEGIDKIPALLERLRESGIPEDVIEKIAYKNALKVIKANID